MKLNEINVVSDESEADEDASSHDNNESGEVEVESGSSDDGDEEVENFGNDMVVVCRAPRGGGGVNSDFQEITFFKFCPNACLLGFSRRPPPPSQTNTHTPHTHTHTHTHHGTR